MMEDLTEKASERKRQIYEALSPRRKKFIDRVGYDKWEPFQEPKHPIEIRMDATKRTTKDLLRDFLYQSREKSYSNAYGQGAFEFAMGMVNKDDKFLAMFDFALWYNEQLKKAGLDIEAYWHG